jgi:hypothetical protein
MANEFVLTPASLAAAGLAVHAEAEADNVPHKGY